MWGQNSFLIKRAKIANCGQALASQLGVPVPPGVIAENRLAAWSSWGPSDSGARAVIDRLRHRLAADTGSSFSLRSAIAGPTAARMRAAVRANVTG